MEYDLTADARDVRTLLTDAVDFYLNARATSPEAHPPVTRVELALDPGDGTIEPELSVDLDVRPAPEADGDADFRYVAAMHRPEWGERLFSHPEGEELRLIFPDGSAHVPPAGEAEYGFGIDDVVARFLALSLTAAHRDGVFDRVADRANLRLTVTYGGNPVWEGPGRI